MRLHNGQHRPGEHSADPRVPQLRAGGAVSALLSVILTALGLPSVATPVWAQTGGGYDLTWSSFDGGGGTSSSGSYTLSGSIGQPDASLASGAGYTLSGGFWLAADGPSLFLPIIQR